MLLLAVLVILSGPKACESICSDDGSRCFNNCRGSSKCMDRCAARQSTCLKACASKQASARRAADERAAAAEKTPCKELADGGVVYCTPQEEAKLQKALKSSDATSRMHCKDKNGEPDFCPDDMKDLGKQGRGLAPKGLCKGADGVPTACP